MKWSDLTLKERKQIYDAVRAKNPNASYFDIKSQFDSIPGYEDGKDNSVAAVYSLPEVTVYPQNKFGDIARTQGYETAKNWQTVRNATTAGIYDGIQTPSQITVFPGSVNKLKIVKKQSIPDFIKNHPEVDEWTQRTTNEKLRNLAESKIPAYGDSGKKIVLPRELGLTPGTPEYYKRQQQISGRAELVRPEVYLTPAGFIKDVITIAEELEKGNYDNAAVSILMNALPWGVGKGLRKITSRVGNILNTLIEMHSSMVDESPSILAEKARRETSKNKKKVKEESDYDSEFSEVIRRDRNIKKYEKEINKTIEDAILPDKKTYELVKGIEDFLFDPRNTGVVNNANKLQYNMYRNKSRFVDRINNLTPMEEIYPLYPIPTYKDGGIHIKKKNKGKFNALKKRTGKSTEELTHSKNPLTRKRAIFAQNAAKWNKGKKKK